MKHIIPVLIALAVGAVFFGGFLIGRVTAPQTNEVVDILPEGTVCTADAMLCPDGTYVGRTGFDCEFVCPPVVAQPEEESAEAAAHKDLIVLATPQPGAFISSPLRVAGEARGSWFFEASFPVVLTNWDGLIIAEGVATAGSGWMTADFVPFTAELTFLSPYKAGDPSFMQRGSLILKKDNPSGLPQNDDALEIMVQFAPAASTAGQ